MLCRTADSDLLSIDKTPCTQNDGGLGSNGAPLNFSFFRLLRRRRFPVWAQMFPFSLGVLLGQN